MIKLSSLMTYYQSTSFLRHFKVFSLFIGLKVNFSKCEIAGLGSLKEVLDAVCSLKSINLTTDVITILGIHFSENERTK